MTPYPDYWLTLSAFLAALDSFVFLLPPSDATYTSLLSSYFAQLSNYVRSLSIALMLIQKHTLALGQVQIILPSSKLNYG